MMTISTYLTFGGDCRAAFEFYRSVFGGEFTVMQTFGDGPPDMGVPEQDRGLIMHVSLPIGAGVLMGSDAVAAFSPAPVTGTNFSLSVAPDSREQADSLLAQLSAGGTVTMPLQDMFWGSYFGSCTDKFGISWQINYDAAQA